MNDNISKNAAAKLLFLSLFFLSSCKAGAGGGTTTDANEKAGPPPDLVISALSTATTAFAPGQSFSVSSTVINKGNGPSDYFIIRFHLSINATYGDKDDIPFLEFREVKSLAAGESNTDSTVLTVPISTPPGSYVLCAKADDKNRISESDNNNNTRCLSTLTLQIEEIRGPSSPPPNGYGYFVKKFTDNSADLGNPRQDGIPDFIVSQAEGKGGGAVYVYSGETGKLIYLIKGTGLSYPADVGDLDGDGVSDLFVGDATSGVAQVYSGLDGAPLTGLTFKGDGDNDGFGESVAAIGDINGDGIPDLIVGAPGGNYAVLYSGVDGSRITRIDSPDGTGSFGCSVTGVINGDGIPDFIIGAPNASPNGKNGAGSAFVYSGQADAKGNFPMLHRLDGEHSGDGFGGCFGAIDTVGDLNGDGKMELAVAASRASPNQLYAAGSIYLFDGATGLPFQRPDRLGPMRLDGEAAYALLDGSLFGSGWISNLGDLNGDGYPDFMAGTSGAAVNGQAYAGRVLIFSGYDGSVLSRIDNPMLNFIPHFFGVSGANLGDLYGDGNLEILIGAGELSDGEPGMGFLFSLNVIPKFQVTYPDLVMVNVTPNDSSVNAGATLLVTNTVKNQWLAPSVGFKIGFNLSPTASYTDPRAVAIPTTRTITSLAAGASSNDITGLVIPSTTPAGSYYICAMVDYANTVKETNESNNTRCSAATVTVPPPDLVMTALSTATTTVGQGERFSLSNTV
ncbi:MAG TPA: CARDB domain-containing protein, partial [Nitrospiria bacterium]|nr:CARDB domain-containing protein [Nitrospiria bacterium]